MMRTKRALRVVARTAAVGAVAAGSAIGTMGAASADQPRPGKPFNGCPSGAVCVYSEDGWYNADPEHIYTAYGAHELHNEFGGHYVFNNQHSQATFTLCADKQGKDCRPPWESGHALLADLTPVNSIKLAR